MLIDTHCHLEMIVQYEEIPQWSQQNYQTVENILKEAANADVKRFITIGTTYTRCLQCVNLAQRNSSVFAVVGLHPCDIKEAWQEDFKNITNLIKEHHRHKIVGVGETGLDFYHPGFNVELQKKVFRLHIEQALEHELPVVIHTRSAFDETPQILQEYQKDGLRGVIHCFGENLEAAQDVQKLGFMMGIGGIITYPKNESLRDVIRTLGLHNIVLETDSPFLPPQTLRGKQNTPANIRIIAEYIAHLLNIPYENVADITTHNAKNLFKLP